MGGVFGGAHPLSWLTAVQKIVIVSIFGNL